MICAGIDPSQIATGWAIGDTAVRARPTSGVFRQQSWSPATSGNLSRRWEDWLYELVEQFKVEALFIENSILPGTTGAKDSFIVRYAQFNFLGIADRLIDRKGIRGGVVNISDWRARFNGQVKRPKHMTPTQGTAWHKKNALTSCAKRGWFVTDHNEAEALAVLDYGMAAMDRSYASLTDPLMRWAEHERDKERQSS
jgi:hypothetical protein